MSGKKKQFKWMDEKAWKAEKDWQNAQLNPNYIAGIDPISSDVPGIGATTFKVTFPENHSGGIFEQIKINPITKIPKDITAKDIEEILTSLYSTKARRTGTSDRQFKIWTGERGHYTFNFIMLYGDTIKVNHFITKFKRINGMYLSLFKKHGMYKLKINGDVMEIYKGTTLLKRFTGCIHQWSIGEDFNNPKIKYTISEVNAYIRKLEKL